MNDTGDILKIRIEKARAELTQETLNAIDMIDWKSAILSLRNKYGYSYEQLGDLELETELLLAGLVSPENYPKELQNRMKISSGAANELVNEMNNLVFKKIREELIKNSERKKIFVKQTIETRKEPGNETQILTSAGIEIIPEKLELGSAENIEGRDDILKKIEKPEVVQPMLVQKLSGFSQIPMQKTEHSLDNITKTEKEVKTPVPQAPKVYPKNADPYRLPPNE